MMLFELFVYSCFGVHSGCTSVQSGVVWAGGSSTVWPVSTGVQSSPMGSWWAMMDAKNIVFHRTGVIW